MPCASCIEELLSRVLSRLPVPLLCDESFFDDSNFNRRQVLTLLAYSVAGISGVGVAVAIDAKQWVFAALAAVIFVLSLPPGLYMGGYCQAGLIEARRLREEANELAVGLRASVSDADEQARVSQLEREAESRALEFAMLQSAGNATSPGMQQMRWQVLEAQSAAYRARLGWDAPAAAEAMEAGAMVSAAS